MQGTWRDPVAPDLSRVGQDGRTIADRVDLLKSVAAQQFAAGKLPMAVKMYTDAIKLAPSHTLYGNRSACWCKGGNYQQAFEDACKAIDLMPTFVKGYARKGAALHGLDRWGEAIKVYEAGLKLEPSNEDLKQGVAHAMKRRALAGGDWELVCHNRETEGERGDMEAYLKHPVAIAPGPNGGVVVLDHGREMVRVMNRDCTYTKCTVNEKQVINRASLFGQACGVACDGDHVYVTDQMRCRVIKCTVIDGTYVAHLGRSGHEDGNFDAPHSLAMADSRLLGADGGANGTLLFVSDSRNHRIVAIDPSDMSFKFKFGSWSMGGDGLMEPLGIAVHGQRILVADSGNRRLALYTLRGELVRYLYPDGGNGEVLFDATPACVALADDAAFVIERKRKLGKDEDDLDGKGRVHVLCPNTGAKLRPPFQPPFALSRKGEGLFTAIAVFKGCLWLAHAGSILLRLPREVPDQSTEGKAQGAAGALAVS